MKRRIRLPRTHFRDQGIKPLQDWSSANQTFYTGFRNWLVEGGYGESALSQYGVAVRLALGLLDKGYWMINPAVDFEPVRDYIRKHYTQSTADSYFKGLRKLAEYLYLRNHRPRPDKTINWPHYIATLSERLGDQIKDYLSHCRRGWQPEQRHKHTLSTVSNLTRFMRWMASQTPLDAATDISPPLWYDYLDVRLEAGISPVTLNIELITVQSFMRFLQDQGVTINTRMLRVKLQPEDERLPRDVPLDHIRRYLAEIEADIASDHAGVGRMGLMDRAWFLLMLQCGLRTGEVRRLKLYQLDLKRRQARIEQTKGLKDRLIHLSQTVIEAIEAYLPVRGETKGEHLFLFRHLPLTTHYCRGRLKTYGKRCGLAITCHQLRHTAATLLLNAGTPILSIQTVLGHKKIDTTLNYARLYDGTVAADYYRAMDQVEQNLQLLEGVIPEVVTPAHLLAMVDALSNGVLNENQRELAHAIRVGLQNLAQQQSEVLELPQEVAF